MSFQTFSYFLFLGGVTLFYYLLPHRARWALLLICSYFFYACWNAAYALLMLASTVITYLSGLAIAGADGIADEARRQGRRKLYVTISVFINLAILFVFKYADMFTGALASLGGLIGLQITLPHSELLLPVGISFYTFQALGYTLDVYRGEMRATRHFGKYALFVSFFPQLVAGPIERSSRLLCQFDEEHRPDFDTMRHGAISILFGLVKKLVIADRLAVLVDMVFSNVGDYGAPAYIVASGCFAFQIYCDFSGYSDIALGSAELLGFKLMRNFDKPYLSRSVNGFWRRWHISLSGWFRDYVYIPMGGSRVSLPRWAINTMTVFTLSGLWHGADWTFVIWGVLNGLYIIAGRLTSAPREALWNQLGASREGRLRQAVSTICTFALITFAWMFFRANDAASLWLMLGRLFTVFETGSLIRLARAVNGRECLLMLMLVCGLASVSLFCRRDPADALAGCPLALRWVAYLGLLFLLILFGKYNESPSFIYFQF